MDTHKILEPGETIEPGDECKLIGRVPWGTVPSFAIGQKVSLPETTPNNDLFIFRRPLKKA